MTRLWLALRRATFEPGVQRRVGKLARRELLTAIADRHWAKHLVWDGWMFAQSLPGFRWTGRLKAPRRWT
jgi:hypothetical protein